MAFAKMLNSQAAVALSVLVSSSSAITAGIMEQRKRRLEKNRQKIEDKLSFIFAPLKGNRLLHQASIEAIESRNKCSVLEHVENICKRGDREALGNWRGFYIKFLAPLDKEAQILIKQYGYLVNDDTSEDIFNKFLKTSATHQFQMEYWFDAKGELDAKFEYNPNDFKVENNCCVFPGYDEMYTRIREINIQLKKGMVRLRDTKSVFEINTKPFNTKAMECKKYFKAIEDLPYEL